MTISYNFHISRPNKIYLNWIEISSPLPRIWSILGRFHACCRETYRNAVDQMFCSFFLGGDSVFQRQRSTVSKKPLRCFFLKKWPLHHFFFGSFVNLSRSSRVTGVVKVMQSSDCPRLWYWSWWVCTLVTGNDWLSCHWRKCLVSCVNKKSGRFFVFEKDNLPMNQTRKWGYLGIHLERHFICRHVK